MSQSGQTDQHCHPQRHDCVDVHYLICGCGSITNSCRASLSLSLSPSLFPSWSLVAAKTGTAGQGYVQSPPTTQSHPNHQSSSCSLYPPRRPPPPSPLSASRQGSLGDGGGRRGSRPQRCSHLARESVCVCVCVCMCVCLRAQRVGVCQCTYLALYHLLSLCVCRRFFLFFFFFFFEDEATKCLWVCVRAWGEREREPVCGRWRGTGQGFRGSLGGGLFPPNPLPTAKYAVVNKVKLSI